MAKDKRDQLAELIARTLAIPRRQIHDETSLFHDCGVAGIDGAEFMKAFAAEFNVDMRSFEIEKYFGVEQPFNPVAYLWATFRGANPRKAVKRLPVRHLEQVMEKGVWFEPPE